MTFEIDLSTIGFIAFSPLLFFAIMAIVHWFLKLVDYIANLEDKGFVIVGFILTASIVTGFICLSIDQAARKLEKIEQTSKE